MKTDIATYLQQGTEGKFYYRMVDTVLSRDKNWARWKAENCPPFQRPPMSAETFAEAKTGAQKACTNKRLRAVPLGSLDLKFLSDGEHADGLEKFQDPERLVK
jgi:THO complex subunit 1